MINGGGLGYFNHPVHQTGRILYLSTRLTRIQQSSSCCVGQYVFCFRSTQVYPRARSSVHGAEAAMCTSSFFSFSALLKPPTMSKKLFKHRKPSNLTNSSCLLWVMAYAGGINLGIHSLDLYLGALVSFFSSPRANTFLRY